MDEIIEQYLAGKLSEVEMESLEDEFFRNNSLFEQLQIVVAEYLDAYLEGSLSPQQKAMIERKLLCTSENRELLITAELIKRHGKGKSKPDFSFSEAA